MSYRFLLCGLLCALLIVGYSPQLLAAELIYDEVEDYEDTLQDSEIDGEVDLSDEDISSSDSDSSIDYNYLQSVITAAVEDALSADDGVSTIDLEDSSYDGSISTTYQTLFASCYLKFASINDDYLLYRSDQYTYNFIIGDLSVSGTTFSGSDCIIISYYTRSSTSGTTTYSPTWTVYNDNISVDASLVYSYSNLGNYAPLPDLMWLVYQQIAIVLGVFISLALFCNSLIEFRRGKL